VGQIVHDPNRTQAYKEMKKLYVAFRSEVHHPEEGNGCEWGLLAGEDGGWDKDQQWCSIFSDLDHF